MPSMARVCDWNSLALSFVDMRHVVTKDFIHTAHNRRIISICFCRWAFRDVTTFSDQAWHSKYNGSQILVGFFIILIH